MKKKRDDLKLVISETDHIHVRRLLEEKSKKILEFAVMHVSVIEGMEQVVTRYDCAHDHPHEDRLYKQGNANIRRRDLPRLSLDSLVDLPSMRSRGTISKKEMNSYVTELKTDGQTS